MLGTFAACDSTSAMVLTMRTLRALLRRAAPAAALYVAACGDGGTNPDARPATLDGVLGVVTSLDVVARTATAGIASGFIAPSSPGIGGISPSHCPYDAASGRFVCATVSASGVTVTRSFTLYDAAGAPQSAFGDQTAKVRVDQTATGTITSTVPPAGTTAIADTGYKVVSNFRAGRPTVDGEDRVHMTQTHAGPDGRPLTATITVRQTIAGLVAPAAGARFPSAGTITQDMTMAGAYGTTTAHAVITFDGSSVMHMTVTVGGMTTTCNVDLAATSPSCR